MSKISNYLSKRPLLVAFIISSIFILSCFFAPRWFTFALLCVTSAFSCYLVIQSNHKRKQEKERMQNLSLEDFHKMYSEYEALVESKIKELGYSREIIYENWLESFHKYLYTTARLTNHCELFTDFQIAASMLFALVSDSTSTKQVQFAYYCVRDLISKPKEYVRHFKYGCELELEVKTTYEEAYLYILEERITTDELCKIIKEIYLTNQTEDSLMRLAYFFDSIYESCL